MEDPNFKWEGGDHSGNLPKAVTADLPAVRTGNYMPTPADEIYDLANEWPDEKAKNLDWSSAGVKVERQELMELCRKWYKEHPDELKEALRICSGLLPEKEYVLVAFES